VNASARDKREITSRPGDVKKMIMNISINRISQRRITMRHDNFTSSIVGLC